MRHSERLWSSILSIDVLQRICRRRGYIILDQLRKTYLIWITNIGTDSLSIYIWITESYL